MSNAATAHSPAENPRVPLGVRNGSSTFLIAIVGLMIANLVPLIFAVFTDQLGFSLVRAGEIVTWSLLASAVSGLGTARMAAGNRRRFLAAIGLIISIFGFGAAAVLGDQTLIVAGFILGGLGAGAAISTSGAAIAAIRNPNRVAATSGFVNRIMVMGVLAILPVLGLAQITVFGTLTLFALCGLALVVWMPAAPEFAEPADVTATLAIASPRRVTIAGVTLLIVFPLWGMSEDAIYAMTGVLATEVGMSDQLFGFVLSAAAGVGALMMALLLIAGNRIGRALPLGITLVLAGATKLLLGFANDPGLLAGLIIAANALYAVTFVMFVAAAAGLDARGRWSAPFTGAYIVGSSFAPLVGAWLVENVGIAGFGIATAVVSFAVLVPAVLAAKVSTGAERALLRAAERAAEEAATRAARERARELEQQAR